MKSLIFILIFAFPTLTNSISILPTNGISGYRNQDFQVTSPPQNYSDTPTRQSNFLKSSVERIANAKWNEMDDESIELLQNNATINWPTPETDFMPYQSNDIKSTLNSSQTIKQMGTMYERSEGSDTTVFQDDCTSVIGWIPQSSWDGEQLVDQIQTGIPLIISNGRYKSGDIPDHSAYYHGPMWAKNFTYPAAVGEGLNLEVDLQHEYSYGYMGGTGVAIYDTNNEIIFKAWIHDAWYGSTSYAKIGYYFLDWQTGGYSSQSVQKSGSWSGTLKVWYDKEADAVKANILGNSYTLVSNPTEEELDRFARTIAIYFYNKQSFAYQSKYINSIKLTVDTSPTTGWPACPQTPAMDGHWFPQTGYSRLYFEVNQPYSDYLFYLRIHIEADQDTYDRILTVKVDGIVYYDDTIYDETGFNDVIAVMGYPYGPRKVELQIRWGGHVEKGWKLLYFYPERANGEPLEILGEYFPKASTARLVYEARLGTDARINLKVEAGDDPIPRYVKVYVDGQFKHSGSGDHAFEWDLGDYSYDSVHEVIVELYYGGYAEWGKKLAINSVSHCTGSVEIDYMSGHLPTQDDLDMLEAYYICLGYERPYFKIDDIVPYVEYFDLSTDGIWPSQQYWDYSNTYRDCDINDKKWTWMLCLHYIKMKGSIVNWFGARWGDYGIFIHDQVLLDNAYWPWTPSIAAYRRSVTIHEYGHEINIIDRHPNCKERYCINWLCAMATADFNIVEYPWYCEHHWSEHRWPGW